MNQEIQDLLEQAISAIYTDLKLESYNFDSEEEVYDIELTHLTANKKIRIGFKDGSKKRNFDVIPLHAMNAPLGLIEIFTTFLNVYWHAEEHNQTILESLSEMLSGEISETNLEIDTEKLVQ
jgi:hypothetical protein